MHVHAHTSLIYGDWETNLREPGCLKPGEGGRLYLHSIFLGIPESLIGGLPAAWVQGELLPTLEVSCDTAFYT